MTSSRNNMKQMALIALNFNDLHQGHCISQKKGQSTETRLSVRIVSVKKKGSQQNPSHGDALLLQIVSVKKKGSQQNSFARLALALLIVSVKKKGSQQN